jgi:hypothetical protein
MDAAELTDAMAGLIGTIEVRENGQRVASLADFRHEVRTHGKRVILHLWSGDRSLARTVLRIAHKETGRLLLEVECFGRSKPGKLEFTSAEAARSEAQLTRDKFREEFTALLRAQFPDEEIEMIGNAADLEHSLSGRYTRALMRAGSDHWAVLAAGDGEPAATIDAMMSFGLLWMEHSRDRVRNGRIAGLRLFFPIGAGKILAHRAGAIDPRYGVELCEINRALGRARSLPREDAGNVLTRLVPRRETEMLLEIAEREIKVVRALAPDEIAASPIAGTRDVALRFLGADFAKWHEGGIYFGFGKTQEPLTERSRGKLEKLVDDLRSLRQASPKYPNDLHYRRQPERWLETMVAGALQSIDAQLDPDVVYSQVPALSAGDRGVIDLLAITKRGRLAILELKASDDLHLVMQAADYWLRVRQHQRQGEFRELGYFPGVELRDEPPLVYLVAPAIRFHPATATLIRYLSPEIQMTRVGLSEDWRSGIQVVLRQ